MNPSDFAKAANPNNTAASKPIPGREAEMTDNKAGGVGFKITPEELLERWMIIGSEEGTYYENKEDVAIKCASSLRVVPGDKVYEMAARILKNNEAPKPDFAIFALAYCAVMGQTALKNTVYKNLSGLLKTAAHLFAFANYFKAINKEFNGRDKISGSGVQRAIARWYAQRDGHQLSYQVTKYQARHGFSHRDLIRLCHIGKKQSNGESIVLNENQTATILHVLGKEEGVSFDKTNHKSILGKRAIERAGSLKEALEIMDEYDLTHEMVPTKFQGNPEFYQHMLMSAPFNATIRRLGAATAHGALVAMGDLTKALIARLTSKELVQRSGIHPISVFTALCAYSDGPVYGSKTHLTWTPVQAVSDALEQAFYLAIGNLQDSGKNILIAVDNSGSMRSPILGANFSAAKFATAMAIALAKSQKSHQLITYSDKVIIPTGFSVNAGIQATMKAITGLTSNGTNTGCVLEYAAKNPNVDSIICITDSYNWMGQQVSGELNKLRVMNKKPIKFVEMITSVSSVRNTDPLDKNSLMVIGPSATGAQLATGFLTK